MIEAYPFVLLWIALGSLFINSRRRSSRDPPGPKGVLFFGNEFQIPKVKQWLYFDKLFKEYGDLVHLRAMGQDMLILSSAQAALDLLDTRGSIYSDRPRAVMAGELVGWDQGLGYAPYGERFKEFRRLFHRSMGPRALQELHSIQEAGTRSLLRSLYDAPEDFIHHARHFAGSTVLKIAYGYSVEEYEDPFIGIAEIAMQGFSEASEPGAFMVDRFPILKYLPPWLPGLGFHKIAEKMRKDLARLYDVPYSYVKQSMEIGNYERSFTSQYIVENEPLSDRAGDFIKAAAASLYSGGADTTPSAITAFILAMTLYPNVQAIGHSEVHALLGLRRLPSPSDMPSLPYVNAIVKELLRWNPAVPLGLPHQLVCNDKYRNYEIKGGTVVWANIWSMLHDPLKFPEPDRFLPERYINEETNQLKSLERTEDPSYLAFGFGRRICPGMHLAESSIFIAIASILQTFDIRKGKDVGGEEIIPEVEFSGFISHTKPFKCEIRPRSEAILELLVTGQ